ncbi:hypothetical protein KDA_17800 [Dictyobacter alpinus]|uniref:Uncharacterized protein n=1 Tax=Dictyobacter alpinus TaxID=2014873 RepID=A0A402B4M4_9CHLR|nr:hypothetical protein [Dictyobacter alpinus]GCE26296.1 hypothetical protein KDA_17800 [Dictyobacter alpinus]
MNAQCRAAQRHRGATLSTRGNNYRGAEQAGYKATTLRQVASDR